MENDLEEALIVTEDAIAHNTEDVPDNSYTSIIKKFLKGACPLFLSFAAIFSVSFVGLYFLGSTTNNSDVMGGYGIGNAWLLLVGFSVFLSLCIGLQSRVSQAFGAKKYELIGLYFHRAIIINIIVLIPSMLLLLGSKYIFELLDFNPNSSKYAVIYLLYGAPGSLCFVGYFTLASVLNGCRQYALTGLAQVISSILYIPVSYLLIVQLDLGIIGSGICYTFSWGMSLILLLIFLKIKNPIPQIFFRPRKESFQQISDLLKYEVIVGCMSWADLVYYEVISLFSGNLSSDEQAGYTIAGTVYKVTYPVLVALSFTTLILAGNSMGAKDKQKTRRIIKVSLWAGIINTLIFEILFLWTKKIFINIYSPNSGSFDYALGCLNILLLELPIDTTQTIMASGVKAIGQEKMGAGLVAISDLLLGIPVAYFCCKVFGLGIIGIPLGSFAAVTGKFLIFSYIFARTDLEKQILSVSVALKQKKSEEINDESRQEISKYGVN